MNTDPNDHILFAMEFMQMMEDFESETYCPACGRESRSGIICNHHKCDFMLFPKMGKIHPAFSSFVESKMKEEIIKRVDEL
tara:strand:- start:536 stop:778 length:243 start_codon:yes stop_codon:yes gene_type:complete